MNNFVSPVSECCGVDTYMSDEDPICSQCGEHCEIVEGDEDTLQFDKELERADFRIKEAKENSI